MFNIVSIITGVTAWVFGGLAFTSKTNRTSHGLSVASFSSCVLALISQILEIGRRVAISDVVAIEDTIRAVIIAAVVLVVVTMVLNVIAFMKNREEL